MLPKSAPIATFFTSGILWVSSWNDLTSTLCSVSASACCNHCFCADFISADFRFDIQILHNCKCLFMWFVFVLIT